MIWGELVSWEYEKQAFHPVLQQGLDWFAKRDLGELAAGRYEIDGELMYVMIQEPETVTRDQRQSEHHAMYVDVQVLIEGDEELHIVARQSSGNLRVKDELREKDFALYDTVADESEITIRPGMFLVYFPNDLHRPACSRTGGTKLKKAVMKIHTSLFGF